MLPRSEAWDVKAFHEYLEARKGAPFVWGEHDCALFAADGIRAITGVDVADDFRGRYRDEAGARAAMAQITHKPSATIEDAVEHCARKHGLDELMFPLMAQRGDLVVLEESGRVIAGLIHLSGRHIVCAGEKGLHRLPMEKVKRAWRV